MTYRIEVDERAVRELLRLPKAIGERVRGAVRALEVEPRPPGAKKLTGRGGYRIRIGDYRVLYEIDDSAQRVRIYRFAHRKDVYR